MTGQDLIPTKTDIVKKDDKIVGVSVTRNSDTVCKQDDKGKDIDYKFTMIVMCDKSITGKGEGKVG